MYIYIYIYIYVYIYINTYINIYIGRYSLLAIPYWLFPIGYSKPEWDVVLVKNSFVLVITGNQQLLRRRHIYIYS